MTLRMKAKFHFCLKNLTPKTYDPLAEASPGTHLYAERVKLTKLFQQTQNPNPEQTHCSAATATAALNRYQTAKTAFFARLEKEQNHKKTAPVILQMELKHGDVVVMHGHGLQAAYEHAVVPKGKLRYALTCRYVKPENIPEAERWKGQFAIGSEEEAYDGSVRWRKVRRRTMGVWGEERSSQSVSLRLGDGIVRRRSDFRWIARSIDWLIGHT